MIERPQDVEQLRLLKLELRQEIIEAFSAFSIRQVISMTGLHQSDISYLRIDNKLNRFSLDRLVLILIAMKRKPVITVELLPVAAE